MIQATETIIITLPEWKQRQIELNSLIEPLQEFKTSLSEFNKRSMFDIAFSFNVAINPQEAIISHVKTLLPSSIGGLPTNKDEVLKSTIIPNHTELSLISSKINNLSEKFNIDINRFYTATKNGIELKEDAYEREKVNYSLVATNESQKAMATHYWLLVNSLCKYERAAKEIIGNGYSIYLKSMRDLVNIDETGMSLKPSFIITDILQPLKHNH